MISFARTDTSLLSRWWWTVDRWMLLALGLLIAAGGLMTLAASPPVAERIGIDPFHFVRRQMVLMPLAIALLLGFSLMTPRTVRRVGSVLFVVFLAATAAAALFGPEYNGASRWLSIAGLALQPSEFLKPTLAIAAAWMFSEQHKGAGFPGNKVATALLALALAALVAQPDFGQSLLISVVWGTQLFLAGLPIVWVAGLATVAAAGLVTAYLSVPYVASRVDRFLEPASGDTYQIDTALNAFRTGGLFGRGPGEGIVKRVLPDAHSDFIFAVMGEEFGIIACLALVAMIAFIVLRALLNLLREDDMFVFLAAAGLIVQFGLQAAINLAVNLDLIPSKGMTLPFISYGGSSLLALSMSMGMLLALTRRRHFGTPYRRGRRLEIGR